LLGMMDFFAILARQMMRLSALSSCALMLASCQRMSTLGFDTQSAFGSVSLAERCVDVMRRAFPEGGFDVTNRRVKVDGNAAVVGIAATRSAIPVNGLYAREVGVECRFDNGILTGFRWTAGPVRPPGVGQAQ
jgi:hypothetical protein